MNSFLLLKTIHLLTIGLSLAGFLLRSYWRFRSPVKLQNRAVKIIPHINDSLLLLSGIGLAISIHQYPFTHAWLTAKLALLLVYIVCGSIVLRTRYTNKTSLVALLIALSSFIGILTIAVRHSL